MPKDQVIKFGNSHLETETDRITVKNIRYSNNDAPVIETWEGANTGYDGDTKRSRDR